MTGRDAEQDVFRRPARPVNVPSQLPNLGRMNTLASWGGQLARALLHEPLPRRWAHVQGVAAQARGLAPVLGTDADLLEAAVWLHDIGYAPGLADTGLHQLDGARYLRDAQHADAMLCRLVAHHSCAIIEAGERGLADALSYEFDPAPDVLASVLTCCDMTTEWPPWAVRSVRIISLSWSPVTESNCRPSPYHGHLAIRQPATA